MSGWKIIAKNEIRLATYRVRKNRKLFFIFTYTITFLWAFCLGPYLIDIILPEILKSFTIVYDWVFLEITEYIFMSLFLFSFMIPLYILYRKKDINHLDMILATPIKPGDIFLGEFVWKIPFYIMGILGMGPFFTSLLMQFKTLTIFHFIIIYITLFVLVIFGSISGKLVANYLERKMIKSEKFRGFNKQILYLFSILMISLYFFIRFLFSYLYYNPDLKNYLMFYPSFWYSNIILFSIDPILISSYIFNIWMSLILAIIFPISTFYITLKKANPTDLLDMSIGKNVSRRTERTERKEYLYDFIKRITLKHFKVLVVIQFKEFFRKKENVNKLVYILFFLILIGIFLSISEEKAVSITQGFSINRILMPVVFAWMGGFFFGILMGANVFINSKELLFLYKRSPRGIKSLISSYLYLMFYLILFLDIILTIFFMFIYQFDMINTILFFIIFLIFSICNIILATGIQCFKPLFEERKRSAFFNTFIYYCAQLASFFITLCVFIPFIPHSIEASQGLLYIIIIQINILTVLTVLIFTFGIGKIEEVF